MEMKVLVAGFGFMGQTHACNLLKIPGAELAGIVDPCPPEERLSAVRGNQNTVAMTPEDIRGVPHYRSLDEALSSCPAHVLVVALPTRFHVSAIMRGVKAGLHVFSEKPLALTPEACALVVRTGVERKRLVAVGQCVRAAREYEFLKETVHSRRLGKLIFLKLNRMTGVPSWGCWRDQAFVRASGGALFDLLLHDIDYLRFCLGEIPEPDAVWRSGADGVSMISARFRYPDVCASVEGGFVLPPTVPFQRSFSAVFENGVLDSHLPGRVVEYGPDGSLEHDFSTDNPYLTEMERFLAAVSSGDTRNICTAEDAARTVACCLDIARRTGYPLPSAGEGETL